MENGSFNPAYNPYGHSAPGLAPQNAGHQQQQQQQQQQPAPPSQQQQQHAHQHQHQQQHQHQHQQQGAPQQTLASFGNLSSQGQQQPSPTHHTTLPPLHTQNAGYSQFGSLSYAHSGAQAQTPTTPHTPINVSMSNNANAAAAAAAPSHAFSHLQANSGAGSMLPPSSYGNAYGMSQSAYPAMTTTSLPATSSPVGLPTIRPMPPGGVSGATHGLPSLVNAGQLGQINPQASFIQNEEAPTHVVGSQGRRGILPSAPGRPNPPPQGSAQASRNMIPQKDADGKYPCPHCSKTYLHAKHLKRHLLRHTGDRPYECHLCKDTFSRSDILKRHFQKCSLRRGNPTGANHLAHQRRPNNSSNRLSISQQDGPIGLAGLPDVAGSAAYTGTIAGNGTAVNGDVSARSSRTNSLISPSTVSQRNSLAGLGILGSNAPNAEQMVTTAPFQATMNAYPMQNTSNGTQMPSTYAFNNGPHMNGNPFQPTNHQQPMPFLGHQSSRFENSQPNNPHQQIPDGDGSGPNLDWTRMFTQSGQDGFIGSHPANASSRGVENIKTEPDQKPDFQAHNDFSTHSFLGNLYSHPSAFGGEDANGAINALHKWGMNDPLQAKVDDLTRHCFPQGINAIQGNPAAELMYACLKVENVKHFVEHYTSYHGHWPILHMPTFKLTEADNNLVLAMLCIGAVYSPNLTVDQVRLMMEFVKSIVLSSCSVYNRAMSGHAERLGNNTWEIEELQALSMLQTLFTWHGDPVQRQSARNEFPSLVQIAKSMGLCQPAVPSSYAYSALHSNPGSPSAHVNIHAWNWQGWLEQEKRNRALYQLFLTDAAMVLFFNCAPQFDTFEIHLPLPADDAAWDAADPQACANALGLNGPTAQDKNLTGTRTPRQPGMREALHALTDPLALFASGTTNAYSKFVLIHALIVRIITCQKLALQGDTHFQNFNFPYNGSTPATPLSQNDWLEHHGQRSGSISANNSGNGTPTDSYSHSPIQNPPSQQTKKRLGQALEKWKRAWDSDMDVQYPPSQSHFKRFGFSRDGVHFFYLGRSFLQSQLATDWTMPADQRFQKVMTLLKRIKGMVIGEVETKGQDIGSVGDIDDQYGLDTLTLDMKLLFKPYNSQLDSPVAGVQTHSL